MLDFYKKPRWGIPFLLLAFLGALCWAKSKDQFRRNEIDIKTINYGKARGIAMRSKQLQRCPIVIYVPDADGNLLASGRELRQFAELGLAAVYLELKQTNQAGFDEQFLALTYFLQRQPWAVNSVAWVGEGLSAERMLDFALRYPEIKPQLLVCLPRGGSSESGALALTNIPEQAIVHFPILLVRRAPGEEFSFRSVGRLGDFLRNRSIPFTEKLLEDQNHEYETDSALLTRLVAEYCSSALDQPFQGIPENRSIPFYLCMLPSVIWTGFYFCRWKRVSLVEQSSSLLPLRRWQKGLRWLAVIVTAWASVETGIYLITPQLAISEPTLAIARHFLIGTEWRGDFENTATNAIWAGKPLKVLLDHAELANYNRNELVNWKVDDLVYREFVLSPIIDKVSYKELNWRRPLWENFFPRIRKHGSPAAAAQTIVRCLRARVTINPKLGYTPGIETTWRRKITDKKGFEVIYVAALRSVGIGARLNSRDEAEYWTGKEWAIAPKPISL